MDGKIVWDCEYVCVGVRCILVGVNRVCKGIEMKRFKVYLGSKKNMYLFGSDGLYMVNSGIED